MGVEDEALLAHVLSISTKDKVDDKYYLDDVPVTFAGFFSCSQEQEYVKPCAVIGVFPVFGEEKANTQCMSPRKLLFCKSWENTSSQG